MKCPACGSPELSKSAQVHATGDHLRFTPGSTTSRAEVLNVHPRTARVCLRCGYVMAFVDRRQIRQYQTWSAAASKTTSARVRPTHSVEMADWIKAAELLNVSLEADPERCWTLEQKDSLYPWRLRYLRHALGWQTLFELTLPSSFPQTCALRARTGADTGQRTGNPVLDTAVWVMGFASVEALHAEPTSTEVVVSAVHGQGLCLKNGRMTLQKDSLVADPMDLIDAATALARLLVRVV